MIRSPRRVFISQASCLFILAFILGVTSNAFRDDSRALFQPLPKLSAKTISLDIAKELQGKEGTVFIDSRSSKSFQRHRIQGSENLPIMNAQSAYPALSSRLLGKTIIVYCSGPRCQRSELLAEILLSKGHSRVYVLKAGLSGWAAQGFPTE